MNNAPITPPPLKGPLAQPWSLGKIAGMLRMFGPAAVIASVAIGAGETIIVVRAGAWMGYGILWLILLAVLVKGVAVTYFLGRYTAISGETVGDRLVRLPGPRGWLLITFLILELASAPLLWGAIARPSGELIGYLLYGSDMGNANRIIATLFIVGALILSLPTSYKLLERQQLIICAILVLGTVIGTILVRPDFAAALEGLFAFGRIPEIPASAPEEFRQNAWPLLAVTFGYVGGSVMTYLVYPDFICLHGWGMTGHPERHDIRTRAAAGQPADYLPTDPEGVKEIRRAASPVRWDVAAGGTVLFVVTAAFLIAGAAVLFPQREAGEASGAFEGWSLLTDQASIWRAIHPALVWVYYICVLAALWGTLQAYPDVYARGTVEYFKAIWPQRHWSQRRVQPLICVYVFATATAIVWTDLNFDVMTLTVNFLATTFGVALAMLAGLYLNFILPAAYRTNVIVLLLGIFSAIALLAVSAISGAGVWQQLTAIGS
ncbi:MAG TPA: Nramp family divalent metal transporter [Lacipirellula sp.]